MDKVEALAREGVRCARPPRGEAVLAPSVAGRLMGDAFRRSLFT